VACTRVFNFSKSEVHRRNTQKFWFYVSKNTKRLDDADPLVKAVHCENHTKYRNVIRDNSTDLNVKASAIHSKHGLQCLKASHFNHFYTMLILTCLLPSLDEQFASFLNYVHRPRKQKQSREAMYV
jgi:hypothetical protein